MSVQKSNGPIIDPALCRCCRAIKKCRVLTAEYNWMGKKEVYADMVMDCYGILLSHVDDNEKDSGVCATCVVRLREAIAFRHQVLQCEELFLQAKLAPPEEETNNSTNYESKLKKLELESMELKTEPKDYNSDHNSIDLDDRDDALPTYSDDEDNKPLKPETKPAEPVPLKDDELKSEDSEDFNGSSSDSDEPIKKKAKRKNKAKANGAKKKSAKAKKQKADTEHTDTPSLNEEIIIKDEIKMEFSETDGSIEDSTEYMEVPVELENPSEDTEVRKKRPWIRDRSDSISEFERLESEGNEELYFSYFNMSKSSFEELYQMVEELIEKADTHMRKCISAKERLAICLRHLRTGHSHLSLATKYNVGVTTVSKVVKEVSRALWSVLQPIYMPAPRENTWKQAAIGFREAWNFPNCVGSIGGKHIIAKHKQESEYPRVSDLACHKRFVTIALLAVTDPYNKIIALDIGNYAKEGDSNIIEKSKFYAKYMDRKNFLPPTPLPGETEPCPYVLIGDGSFTLKHNLLRSFPKTINYDDTKKTFNRWLDKACTVDKTFQILMDSWAILHRPMETQVESAVAVLKAICCLHNYILAKHGKMHPFGSDVIYKISHGKRSSRKILKCLKPFRATSHRPTNAAMIVRDRFVAYFNRLDPFESEDPIGTANGPNESIDTVESLHQPNESNDNTVESLHQPDELISVTIESFNQPTELIENTVESFHQKNESTDNTVESLHQPDELISVTIESFNQPTELTENTVESLRQPSESNDNTVESFHQKNESTDNTVGSLHQPDELISVTIESFNQPTELIENTVESLRQPSESNDNTVESFHQMNESTDNTVGSLHQPDELISVTIESFNQPTELIENTVESLQQPSESNDNTVESFHQKNESTDNTVESLHQPYELINVTVESLDQPNESTDCPIKTTDPFEPSSCQGQSVESVVILDDSE